MNGLGEEEATEGTEEEVHRTLLSLAGMGVVRVAKNGIVLWMDDNAHALLQHALLPVDPSGKETGSRLLTYGCGGAPPWEIILHQGRAKGLPYRVRDAFGKLIHVTIDGYRRPGKEEPEVVLLVHPEAKPCETTDSYRAVFDEVNDGIVVHDIETGAIVDMNRKAAELFKMRDDDAPPLRPHETTCDVPPEHADDQARGRMHKAAAGEPQVFEWPAVDRQGRAFCLEVSLKRARIGFEDRLLAVVRDITDRKATEHALRTSQERYRAIIEATHDMIWALDEKGNFTFVNGRGQELTGYDLREWEGKSFAPLIHPEDLQKSQDAFMRTMQGEPVRYEVRMIDAWGQERRLQANLEPLREDGRIVGMVGLGTDITTQTRMEDELHKAQKLESLGLLAGGIAHDFNNILTAIVGGVTLARRSVGRPSLQQETLDMAEKACLRARDLTQQLLTFSRGGAPIRKPASIAELLEETSQFALRGSNVRCEIAIAPDLDIVSMDAGQMSQVFNNLLINAAQAMPKGGTVTLRADSFLLERAEPRFPTLKPGPYVRISVSDEGDGIPKDLLPNIFDPYFTTKPSGSGLGLATCYSIINRHDGFIEVESVPGVGTSFHIYLPSTKQSIPPSRSTPLPSGKRGGLVLLMDDDPMVREVGEEMLRLLGYDVIVTKDGREAVHTYEQALASDRPVDVVILDLTVPGGMGGREAATVLRNLHRSVRLIASSGYSTDPVMADHEAHGFDGVVAKPYVPEDLDRVLLKVLDRQDSTA